MTDAERLALSKAAHDLNNIFCLMLSSLEMLQAKNIEGTERILFRAMQGIERGGDVVDRLRKLRERTPELV